MVRNASGSKAEKFSQDDTEVGSHGRSLWSEVLRHKSQNKVWTAEEKYELVAKVLAGVSNKEVSFTAGIDDGLLYQWVRCYKMKGYQGLAEQRKRKTTQGA